MSRYRLELVLCLLLVALTLAALGHVGKNDFIDLDDGAYATDNNLVKKGLTADGLRWAWTTLQAGHWHPLTWLSLQLDASLGKLFVKQPHPAIFHLTNLQWHLASVLLLFVVLRRMTGAVWRSALVAALFAVHPLHVESVAWVAERKDVLSTFFWILTMGLYAWYAERPGWSRYLLVLLSFILGLLAKPMLVTLPCALLLLDYWPLRRFPFLVEQGTEPAYPTVSWKLLLLEKVPLVLLLVGASVITYHAQKEVGAVMQLGNISISERVGNALVSYVQYLWQTMVPVGLSIFYPHPFHRLAFWQVGGAALLLAGLTVVVYKQRHTRPYLIVGWLWFLGTLVPVIGLVQVGEQARADRFTYVPHIGLFVLLVWGGADLLARWPRPMVASLTIALLVGFGTLTWLQVRHWRNTESIWEHAVAVDPENARAHANLGSARWNQGRRDEAIEHLTRSVTLDPKIAETNFLLAEWLDDEKRFDEAAHYFIRTTELRPDLALPFYKLGLTRLRQEKQEVALKAFAAAIERDPDLLKSINFRGLVAAAFEKWKEASLWFEIAVSLDRQNANFRVSLARVLHEQKRTPEAILELEQALRLAQAAGQLELMKEIEAVLLEYRKIDQR